MQKFLLSILTLLYMASTTGAMLESHFCMGRLADWSIGHSAGEQCGLCGMQKSEEKDNSCCSDEESFFKVTDDQKAPGSIATPSIPSEATLPSHTACHVNELTRPLAHLPVVHAPPGSPGTPRHVLISVFRI